MEAEASQPGHTRGEDDSREGWLSNMRTSGEGKRQRELEDEEMDERSRRQWFIHAG